MPYDGFFLEFDDVRSGDFSPLRHVPRHVRVVLGLVTSKMSPLEKKDDLKRRLDEASKYIALEQLCVSPQCGFSSTVEGNDVTVEDERAKLSLCVGLARDVWGRHAVRIERFCIVDIGPEVHLPGLERIGQMMAGAPERIESEEQAVEFVRRANPRMAEAGLRDRVRHGLRPMADGGFEWKYDKALREMMRQGGRRDTIDLWEPLRRIAVPALLVRGAESDVLSADVAKRMIDA